MSLVNVSGGKRQYVGFYKGKRVEIYAINALQAQLEVAKILKLTDKQRNWLPTARGDTFQLAARFYGPMAPLVDGSYPMPAIEAADTRATPGRH